MRNLKRALSLVMAAAMLIGMMVVSAGAASTYEDFTDKDEIQNTEAVATMVSLGVFNGKEDGSYFDPTGIVTRAEMAKIIAVCLNGGRDPVLGSGASTTQFSDTKGNWAEAYIAYCANLGIINGRGDGTFGPSEPVTGTAAAKMFLTALGYRSDIEKLTGAGWDLNTDTLANKIGLYDGLDSIVPSSGLSRDNTAQLVYNGVQAFEVEYKNNYGEYSGVIYAQEQQTMLTSRFGVLKVTGIAAANSKLALNGYGVAKEDFSRIHVTGVSGYDTVPASLGGNPVFKVNFSDDMIGQEVVIYVKFLNELSPNAVNSTVMGNAIVTDSNTVVETTGRLKDTDAVKSALRGSGIAVNGSQVETSYNHLTPTAVPAVTAGESAAVTAARTNGVQLVAGVSQRFIDNDNDGIVEYIIQTTPTLAKVTAVNTSGEKITFSSPIGAQDFDDVVNFEDLAKDDYVLITKYDDGKYYPVLAETVESEVTAFTPGTVDSITAGEKYVKGAGANLASDVAVTLGTSLIGDTYTLYLDNSGNVLGAKLVSAAVSNYAVVLGASVTGNSAMGYTAKVKLLQADGTKATYDVDLLNTSVKLAGTAASAVDSVKEAAVVGSGNAYFDTATSGGAAGSTLANLLVSYTVDDDKTVILANPHNVNAKYTKSDITASQTLYKNDATYNSTAGTLVADENTVFFIDNNTAGSYSVVTGLSKLPSAGIEMTAAAGQSIYYQATATSALTAKAIYVKITSDYASNTNYAFIVSGYTQTSDGGTPIYTYPVVLEDGTYTTLSTKTSNAVKNTVMTYTLDSKGYASFGTDGQTETSGRVGYLEGSTVSLNDLDTDAYLDSYVLDGASKVWNVIDASTNIFDTSLSESDCVAIITDATTGAVKTAFIFDTMLGDMTAAAASVSVDADSVTYTATTAQKVKVTVDGTEVQAATAGTGAPQTVSGLSLTTASVVKLIITEDNKDTRTMTVSTAGITATAAPTGVTFAKAGGTITGTAPNFTLDAAADTNELTLALTLAAGQSAEVTGITFTGAQLGTAASAGTALTGTPATVYTFGATDVDGLVIHVAVKVSQSGYLDYTTTYNVTVSDGPAT